MQFCCVSEQFDDIIEAPIVHVGGVAVNQI